jgi:hypothetical protein
MDEKIAKEFGVDFAQMYEKINSYRKDIFKFHNDFKPAKYPPQEEGYYVTIRCGLSGIYQVLNQWKDGKWQMQILDASDTIAYSKEKVEL